MFRIVYLRTCHRFAQIVWLNVVKRLFCLRSESKCFRGCGWWLQTFDVSERFRSHPRSQRRDENRSKSRTFLLHKPLSLTNRQRHWSVSKAFKIVRLVFEERAGGWKRIEHWGFPRVWTIHEEGSTFRDCCLVMLAPLSLCNRMTQINCFARKLPFSSNCDVGIETENPPGHCCRRNCCNERKA